MEKKRDGILVNAWLVPGQHDELIRRWKETPKGERSTIIINALELYFKLPASKRRDPLHQVREDTTWLKDAMNELPDIMKQMIADLLAEMPAAPANSNGRHHEEVEDDLTRERDKAMRKNKW